MLMVATLDRSLRNFFPHMDACRAAGCRVDVACRISDFEDEIRQHCDNLYPVPFRRFPLHPLNLATLLSLVKVIKSEQYDIVHSHTPAGGMIGRAAATIAGTPVRIYMAHGFHFHPEGARLTNLIFGTLERFAGNNLCDWVEVINTEDYQNAIGFKVVPKEKLVMIDGTGIDTARFDPATISAEESAAVRSEFGLLPNTPVVGVIAELIPRKRLLDTLSAVATLKVDFPNIALIILGSGDQRAELEARMKELDLVNNVHFLGFRRDLPRFVSVMDVFAFSTQQEGLPAALLEAMCMGIPSVATDIRGNRDIIIDGENGLLVKLGDSKAMAAACKRLIEDPDFAANIGKAGRNLVVSKYDTKRTVGQQMAAYGRAMEQAKSKGLIRPTISTIPEWDPR
jgi:glycosyltransferase involved in cell wall biosynthesis